MSNSFPKNKIEFPTVGRIVLFYAVGAPEPWPAIVVSVPDRPLYPHLQVFSMPPTGVIDKDVPHMSVAAEKGEAYWDWMPYQKSQAAKTEQLQRELEQIVASTKTHPLP